MNVYTTENFWCPRCGRLPLQMGRMYVAPGIIGGWTSITCARCGGTDGDIACRGETAACVVLPDGFCRKRRSSKRTSRRKSSRR